MYQTGEFYHVYNRGIEKRKVFMDDKDYYRFLESLREFNCEKPVGSLRFMKQMRQDNLIKEGDHGEKIVRIIAYCLNPNHYHLLLKQLVDGGISEFLKRMGGYTKYINEKYDRSGVLFQGKSKKKQIKSSYLLSHMSAYINGNPEIHGYAKAEHWPWSSCRHYLGHEKSDICSIHEIMKDFNGLSEYKRHLSQVIKESGQIKKEIKTFLLE